MQIGISVTSSFTLRDVGGDLRAGVRNMLAQTRAARLAGFDSLFVGDHHAMASPYYQNVPMLGRMLAEWNDNAAGALFLLPLWNPVLVAEQTATLACAHAGPFILQCGLGRDAGQFAAMGTSIANRVSAFEENLHALRRLWAGETVTLSHRYRNRAARIAPLPPEPIEVWIGASAPAAIERAARLGDAWLADPSLPAAEAATSLARYLDACAACGRMPRARALRRDVHVAASVEAAQRDVADIVGRGYRGFDPQALLIGSVESVSAELAAFAAMGFDHVLMRCISNEQQKAVACIEAMGAVRKLLRTG